jgi:hypothetical protein
MRTRLDDLIATAERQMASHSYDAAIDTYRTALGEPGAVEAGVEQRLERACRVRDEERGVVRFAEAPAPPLPLVASMPAPPPEPRVELDPEPEPACAPQVFDDRPIEPPSFHLVEDDPSMLERFGRKEYPLEVEKLSILERPRRDRYIEYDVRSILDPTPQPDARDPRGAATRLLIAMLIAIAVVLVAYYAK